MQAATIVWELLFIRAMQKLPGLCCAIMKPVIDYGIQLPQLVKCRWSAVVFKLSSAEKL